MHLLELFSGTGSIGKAFEAAGWTVTSVDIEPKFKPTILCDVMNLDVSKLPKVDLLWASPVCTMYSNARSKGGPRDLEGSDKMVQRVLDIAAELGVPFFFENPYTGSLRKREVVAGIPFRTVDYCKYGAPYRKRTCIWTNTQWVPERPLCKYDCHASDGRKHTAHAQQGAPGPAFTQTQLYRIPAELCEELAAWASAHVRPS